MSKQLDKAFEILESGQVDDSTYDEIVKLMELAPKSEEYEFAMILEGVSMEARDGQ